MTETPLVNSLFHARAIFGCSPVFLVGVDFFSCCLHQLSRMQDRIPRLFVPHSGTMPYRRPGITKHTPCSDRIRGTTEPAVTGTATHRPQSRKGGRAQRREAWRTNQRAGWWSGVDSANQKSGLQCHWRITAHLVPYPRFKKLELFYFILIISKNDVIKNYRCATRLEDTIFYDSK